MSKSGTRKWNEVVPKIVKVARIENDPIVDVLLENMDDYSDGKFLA